MGENCHSSAISCRHRLQKTFTDHLYYHSNRSRRRAYDSSSFWLSLSPSVVVKNYYYCYYYCIDLFDCRFLRSTCGTGSGGCLCFPLHCFLLRNCRGCSCLPSPPPWLPSIIFVPAQSTSIICSCLAFKPVLKPEAASSLFPLHSYSYSEALLSSSSLSLLC